MKGHIYLQVYLLLYIVRQCLLIHWPSQDWNRPLLWVGGGFILTYAWAVKLRLKPWCVLAALSVGDAVAFALSAQVYIRGFNILMALSCITCLVFCTYSVFDYNYCTRRTTGDRKDVCK